MRSETQQGRERGRERERKRRGKRAQQHGNESRGKSVVCGGTGVYMTTNLVCLFVGVCCWCVCRVCVSRVVVVGQKKIQRKKKTTNGRRRHSEGEYITTHYHYVHSAVHEKQAQSKNITAKKKKTKKKRGGKKTVYSKYETNSNLERFNRPSRFFFELKKVEKFFFAHEKRRRRASLHGIRGYCGLCWIGGHMGVSITCIYVAIELRSHYFWTTYR